MHSRAIWADYHDYTLSPISSQILLYIDMFWKPHTLYILLHTNKLYNPPHACLVYGIINIILQFCETPTLFRVIQSESYVVIHLSSICVLIRSLIGLHESSSIQHSLWTQTSIRVSSVQDSPTLDLINPCLLCNTSSTM